MFPRYPQLESQVVQHTDLLSLLECVLMQRSLESWLLFHVTQTFPSGCSSGRAARGPLTTVAKASLSFDANWRAMKFGVFDKVEEAKELFRRELLQSRDPLLS